MSVPLLRIFTREFREPFIAGKILRLSSNQYYLSKARIVKSETKPDHSIVQSASAPITESIVVNRPAFKEWGGIVDVLGLGTQIILLRKGGIAEGRTGFQVKHPKFWLFPTRYHQQWEKSKPELRRSVPVVTEASEGFVLQYFAEVMDVAYLHSWVQVARLNNAHFWGDEILRERFDYMDRPGMEAGLHLLIVRVSKLNLPHRLAPSPEFEGCKSWIEVPVDWAKDISTTVLDSEEFEKRRSLILAAIAS